MNVEFGLQRVDCTNCGMIMFYPKNFIEIKQKNYSTFYCGAGHPVSFVKPKPDAPESLKERISQLEKEKTELKTQNVQLYHKLEQAGA